MKVYIAGPLFNTTELQRNRELRDFLVTLGFETYLPQEDGGISYEILSHGGNVQETRKNIFKNDVKEIHESDIILCLLDGRVPDEGMCIELGIGYSSGKICIGYLTDKRSFDVYGLNLMIEGCLKVVVGNMDELRQALSDYYIR